MWQGDGSEDAYIGHDELFQDKSISSLSKLLFCQFDFLFQISIQVFLLKGGKANYILLLR